MEIEKKKKLQNLNQWFEPPNFFFVHFKEVVYITEGKMISFDTRYLQLR